MEQSIRFCTSSDGVKLAYAVTGDGPPLVMSATWLTHLEHQWRSLAWKPWLEALSRDHRLLRYDLRGCGLSDRDIDNLSFETWIKDFEKVIDAAGFGRFSLVSTCWGGPVAIEYAARHPERVDRLVLYGTYARGRLRRSDQPKEVEKARVLLDLTRLGWGLENHAFLQVWANALPARRQHRARALVVRPAARGDVRRDGGPAAGDRLERRCERSRAQHQMPRSRDASRARRGGADRRRPPARKPHPGCPLRHARQRKPYAARRRAGLGAAGRRDAGLSDGAGR